MAVPLVACILDVPDAFGECGECGAGHARQGGVGEQVGQPRALPVIVAGDELSQRGGGAEAQCGRLDRVVVFGEQLAGVGDRAAD